MKARVVLHGWREGGQLSYFIEAKAQRSEENIHKGNYTLSSQQPRVNFSSIHWKIVAGTKDFW